jgi:hypothetical protein
MLAKPLLILFWGMAASLWARDQCGTWVLPDGDEIYRNPAIDSALDRARISRTPESWVEQWTNAIEVNNDTTLTYLLYDKRGSARAANGDSDGAAADDKKASELRAEVCAAHAHDAERELGP